MTNLRGQMGRQILTRMNVCDEIQHPSGSGTKVNSCHFPMVHCGDSNYRVVDHIGNTCASER